MNCFGAAEWARLFEPHLLLLQGGETPTPHPRPPGPKAPGGRAVWYIDGVLLSCLYVGGVVECVITLNSSFVVLFLALKTGGNIVDR